jgi:hypothetical protein
MLGSWSSCVALFVNGHRRLLRPDGGGLVAQSAVLSNGRELNFRQCAHGRSPIDKTPTHPYLSAELWSEKPEKGRFPDATLLLSHTTGVWLSSFPKMIGRIARDFSFCASAGRGETATVDARL